MQQGSAYFALGDHPQTCGPKTRAEYSGIIKNTQKSCWENNI